MMRKDMKNMVGAMDHLIGEHKNIPVYAKNLYKWTSEPGILKQDAYWDASTLEDLECPYCKGPYCKDEIGDYIIDDSSIITYISGNYLWVELFEPHNLDIVFSNINYCPMCGRSLK